MNDLKKPFNTTINIKSLTSASEQNDNVAVTATIVNYLMGDNETVIGTTESTSTTNGDDVIQDDSLRFILIPLAVLLSILALSALVFLMARNRRRLAHIYCKHRSKSVPSFTFDDDSDSALEQGDELDFDDPTECLLKGKLQIDNSYETYQTTRVIQSSAARRELYT